jgi:putative colanic acid biosynthesis glycosyltransferase
LKKISIICATYNAASTIRNLLKSILEQDFFNYELVIIDGASTDNTLEIINSYKIPHLIVLSEKDLGIYDAMNKGANTSTGEWLFFIGADDVLYDRNTLSTVNKNIEAAIEADAVCGNVLMGTRKLFVPQFSSKLLFINSIHHQGIFYNRRLFSEYKYNVQYRISADYELNLILHLKKAKIVYTNRIISIAGEHGVSSKTNVAGYLEEIAIRSKLLKNPIQKNCLNLLTLLRFSVKKYLLGNYHKTIG